MSRKNVTEQQVLELLGLPFEDIVNNFSAEDVIHLCRLSKRVKAKTPLCQTKFWLQTIDGYYPGLLYRIWSAMGRQTDIFWLTEYDLEKGKKSTRWRVPAYSVNHDIKMQRVHFEGLVKLFYWLHEYEAGIACAQKGGEVDRSLEGIDVMSTLFNILVDFDKFAATGWDYGHTLTHDFGFGIYRPVDIWFCIHTP